MVCLVRHLEERDAACLTHLGNASALAGLFQGEPVGVVEIGSEEWDDGEGAVDKGLVGTMAARSLATSRVPWSMGIGRIILLHVVWVARSAGAWRISVYATCDREGHASDGIFAPFFPLDL